MAVDLFMKTEEWLVQTVCGGTYRIRERRRSIRVLLAVELTFIQLCLSRSIHRLLPTTAYKHT